MEQNLSGGFTLPGEAGYEALTLQLAQKWRADIIRDSDGTQLSDDILNSGYGIYSTICIIRDHNEFARCHPECRQQTFLSTEPMAASGGDMTVELLSGFSNQQFAVNESAASQGYWQVWNRTTGTLLDREKWSYRDGAVTIRDPEAFHRYSVSFLAYRIWEEISMYNHITNHWEKEHLIPIDPRLPVARDYLLKWLDTWCQQHPATTVVRFTSMFYNFTWIWGSDPRNQSLFTDWGSYDFTVSEKALADFEAAYGYPLTAEDFINQGNYQVTHMPPSDHKRDYMAFTHCFVAELGREMVSLVHSYGKKAYVFYDDSWVGVEPYGPHFQDFQFDGIIKCVFSGFEVRLCAGVPTETHELRLHPYLFPTGLNGRPTFMEGGNPARDARQFWASVRRALLRVGIDRIGLGGYLHLTEAFPDFADCIAEIAHEFRTLRALHHNGGPYTLPLKIAVVHSWGSLRPWTLSGHFHETYMHDLIHINEALSGLPVHVTFLSFEDVKAGKLSGIDVVINAGRAGTAWSGGGVWADSDLVSAVTQWVSGGGVFLGVGEPTALSGGWGYFRLRDVLGVDRDTGARVCHGRWQFDVETVPGLFPDGSGVTGLSDLYLTDGRTRVLATDSVSGLPTVTAHHFGAGQGIYLSSFQFSPENTRMLLNLMLWASGKELEQRWLTDNPAVECAWYPADRKLVVINNTGKPQKATVKTDVKSTSFSLSAYGGEYQELK